MISACKGGSAKSVTGMLWLLLGKIKLDSC